jgi:hypothetical protein
MSGLLSAACLALAVAASPVPSPVSFQLMQIEYAVGGVNGDTTAQAIQLRMREDEQNHVSGARLVAYDAAGQNPVVLVDFESDVPNGAKGNRILITTAALLDLTDPPTAPDFALASLIPAEYLAAGRLTYESDDGSEIFWSLAVGGDAYTGPHDGSILNDDDGDFGPAFAGPFPTGVQGLHFDTYHNSKSRSNATDYAAIKHVVLRNNAGEDFTLFNDPCYADCDGSLTLDLFDFLCFVGAFNADFPYADCDGDGKYTLFDFFCFINEFDLGC